MESHILDGESVCIHSVCVDSNKLRQGTALAMLQHYPSFVAQSSSVTNHLLLICKEPLISLYRKAGFELRGPSDVVHGADPWFEMLLTM
jgi:cyclin-dependent kinase-like